MKELGSIGWKTFAYYVCTTAIAVVLGLAAVLIIRPGHKDASSTVRENRVEQLAEYRQEYYEETGVEDPLANNEIAAYRQWIAAKEGESIGKTGFGSKWSRIMGSKDISAGDMFRRDILLPILSISFSGVL